MFDATRKERIELEWIDEYARRSRRELEKLGRKAEEAVRRLPAPVIQAGLRSLPGGAAAYAAQALLPKRQRPGSGGTRQEPPRTRRQGVAARTERRTGGAQAGQRPTSAPILARLNENPLAIDLAGYLTRQQLQPLGAVRGMVNTVGGLLEAAPLMSLAINPLVTMVGPNRKAALEQATDLAIAGSDYFKTRAEDPSRFTSDVRDAFHDWRVKHDPTATPQADTALGEVIRNVPIGLNNGELGFDLVSALYGGAELKGLQQLSKAAKMSKAERVAMHHSPNYSSKFAENFASPYVGEGHHFIPKRVFDELKLPEPVKDILKEHFMDSKWNVLKPEGIDKGLMYKLHYFVDPFFHGGRTPRSVPERGFSGKRMDWEKAEDTLARIWHGRPTAVRKAGANAVGVGIFGDISDWLVPENEALVPL